MKTNYLIGIWFKLLNCLLFPTLSLLMVKCASDLPVIQIFFVQVSLGTIISFLYLKIIKCSIPLNMSKKDLLLYLARAITNLIAMYLWIFSLNAIGINEATALGYTGPLWVFLMARYILGEQFKGRILLLIAVNIIGMIIILKPQYADIHLEGVLASIGAILLWSVYEVICKKQASDQHYMLQTFYFMLISALISFPFIFNSWHQIDLKDIGVLTIISLLAVTNITVIFVAYFFSPLTLLAPFSYSRLIFTVILSAWVYQITPSINVFIGAAIIMIANGYFAYRIKNNA